MNPNKLTPGYNIMWESSRMMLPEHREQLLAQKRKKRIYTSTAQLRSARGNECFDHTVDYRGSSDLRDICLIRHESTVLGLGESHSL